MTDTGAPGRRRRRLAAILMADVVGFSRMMGRDDEGTTSRILTFHQRVRATVEAHSGRVVATAGDSVFGDFDSIVEALDCAIEIQRSLHEENEALPEDERIEIRMGLHIGDVIVEEYNVFGDGVNIASRLEQLADPGGIVVSEAVYQQVKGRRDLPFRDLGTRTLKNIDHPVRLYGLGPDAYGAAPAEIQPGPPQRERREVNRALREAIADKVRSQDFAELAETAKKAGKVPGIVIRKRSRKGSLARALGPGTLVLAAIGALMVSALTTGWTDNGWYPFGGVYFLALAAARIVRILSGRRGAGSMVLAAGLAGGALFLDHVAARVVFWVIAAALAGTAIQRLTGEASSPGRAGDGDEPDGA